MQELQQDQDSRYLVQESKLASPSNYWGRGNFVFQQVIISPELREEILLEDPEETQSPILQASKLS